MNKQQLQNLINSTKGKYFTLAFETKDGDLRVVNAREKDFAHMRGGVNRLDKTEYVSVFDRNKNGWVSCHPRKIRRLSCGRHVNFHG